MTRNIGTQKRLDHIFSLDDIERPRIAITGNLDDIFTIEDEEIKTISINDKTSEKTLKIINCDFRSISLSGFDKVIIENSDFKSISVSFINDLTVSDVVIKSYSDSSVRLKHNNNAVIKDLYVDSMEGYKNLDFGVFIKNNDKILFKDLNISGFNKGIVIKGNKDVSIYNSYISDVSKSLYLKNTFEKPTCCITIYDLNFDNVNEYVDGAWSLSDFDDVELVDCGELTSICLCDKL